MLVIRNGKVHGPWIEYDLKNRVGKRRKSQVRQDLLHLGYHIPPILGGSNGKSLSAKPGKIRHDFSGNPTSGIKLDWVMSACAPVAPLVF